nr:phosphatase PAP2 family protein [Pantoea sp. 201603H]
MRISLPLAIAALLATQGAYAKSFDYSQVTTIVDTTTPASDSPAFVELESQILQSLRQSLQNGESSLTRGQLEQAKQGDKLADRAWLKASGYDFQPKENAQAGIALLESFNTLSDQIKAQSLATVTRINRDATAGERHQALADAEGISYLYFLADAMGPKLGKAFLTAYDKGELNKAAALIKASEVSTSAAKKHFNYPRPFLQPDNLIHKVPDDVVVKDNQPYSADGGAFPSGHTNTGYTDALLMAQMIPERYVPLIDRGARYGYSRIVLGVHYPLDVMGSRMITERNVAHYLNDPNYRKLFEQAKAELRSALEKECGMSLSQCAKSDAQSDPYASPSMKTFYRFTMTYQLPKSPAVVNKVDVPPGAEVLLEAPLPNLSPAQRRALMVNTALADGYPLSGGKGEQNFWQRLNLHDAVESAHSR